MNRDKLFERFSLDGRTALITDMGLGPAQEVAPLLAAAGAKVFVANSEAGCARVLAQGMGEGDCAGSADAVNFADEACVAQLFDAAHTALGGIDILVNCAALTLNVPFTQATTHQLEVQFAHNLVGPFLLMREAVRRMQAAGRGGRIVNISTIGASHPVLEGNALYSASRAALNMMCRNIALEHMTDRILVNTVLPGAFQGKVTLHADTLAQVQAGRRIDGPIMQPGRMPLGYGDPQDIASAVLYLVGPSGGFITGQAINLDGGFLVS